MKVIFPAKEYLSIFLFILSIPSMLKSEISFSDSNFEKLIREKVENYWIYIPSYTGSSYQFKEGDFHNVYSLDFEDKYLKISSLTDLRWFPNLEYLHIWDASQISDFSPIWQLSDQLKSLAINGSRGGDLSGVSIMNSLEYLDLDNNQLTDLSILGYHPDLLDLWIVGNYLDLSNPVIKASIEGFAEQILQTRRMKGWWYTSSDAVEFEPQYPKSFQDLSGETIRVQQILTSAPSDAKANLLRSIYSLLNIIESTDATGMKEFAVSIGVEPSIRNFVLSDLSVLEDYETEINPDFQFGKIAEFLEKSIIPDLEEIDFYLSRIPSSSIINLEEDITGSDDVLTVDYADILVLRTITNLLAALASLQSGYNWDLNAGQMETLDHSGEISLEEIRGMNSNFGGIRSVANLAKAKVFLQNAIDLYQEASPLLTYYSRWDMENRLFVLSFEDLTDEMDFREALLEMESTLAGAYAFEDGGDRIDFSRLFSGQVDLAKILPESKKDKFLTDHLDDPTIGGLLPDWNQERVSKEIKEANLLWDGRAMLFWRWEQFLDNPVSWDKQSVVLRYLGDESEEILFSVNAKDLITELDLSMISDGSAPWLEDSKVFISPDASNLIFGYALVSAMNNVAGQKSRFMVRIINYNMVNRTSSIIREWTGSNLTDSMNSKYVDFCIDALAVDWKANKIYFSEEIINGNEVNGQIEYIKLVSCDFDGQNLTAVKRFDRDESGMTTLTPTISMLHISDDDPSMIRVSLEYSDSMGTSKAHEIHTIDTSGNQTVVPIENKNRGGITSRYPLDSFSPISISVDSSEIYFITYGQDFYDPSVIEPSISKMTTQGYDQKLVADLWRLGYKTDIWGNSLGVINPSVVMMTAVENGKIILGVHYYDQWYNHGPPPEIIEVDLASGEHEILTVGKFSHDNFSTASLFYPDGKHQTPKVSIDSDGDGLPDDVEIAAGMNPNSSDKAVVNAVYNYFFSQGHGTVKSLTKTNPYTHNWYFQPELGWMWTNSRVFPYIFKSGTNAQSGDWMYFSEQSSEPIQIFDYGRKKWLRLGE